MANDHNEAIDDDCKTEDHFNDDDDDDGEET